MQIFSCGHCAHCCLALLLLLPQPVQLWSSDLLQQELTKLMENGLINLVPLAETVQANCLRFFTIEQNNRENNINTSLLTVRCHSHFNLYLRKGVQVYVAMWLLLIYNHEAEPEFVIIAKKATTIEREKLTRQGIDLFCEQQKNKSLPVHDRKRLRQWLQNMKRGSWIPTKHHYLCSDHFTPDSFDVRWGIRYLKQTAVPTIFTPPQSLQGGDCLSDNVNKIKADTDMVACRAVEPCLVLESCTQTQNLGSGNGTHVKAGIANTPSAGEITCTLKKPAEIETHPGLKMDLSRNPNVISLQESSNNLLNVTILDERPNALESKIEIDPTNTASSKNLKTRFGNSSLTPPPHDNDSSQQTVTTQNVEQLKTNKEPIFTFLLPVEGSADPSLVAHSLASADQHIINIENTELEDSSYNDMDSEAEVLQIEHSYCRQDFDREELWQKISKLNSKITFLERQENDTLSRLKSLKALIGKLKQENLLSEEKLKLMESCFPAYEVTII